MTRKQKSHHLLITRQLFAAFPEYLLRAGRAQLSESGICGRFLKPAPKAFEHISFLRVPWRSPDHQFSGLLQMYVSEFRFNASASGVAACDNYNCWVGSETLYSKCSSFLRSGLQEVHSHENALNAWSQEILSAMLFRLFKSFAKGCDEIWNMHFWGRYIK